VAEQMACLRGASISTPARAQDAAAQGQFVSHVSSLRSTPISVADASVAVLGYAIHPTRWRADYWAPDENVPERGICLCSTYGCAC
jgi:hypothetical protein